MTDWKIGDEFILIDAEADKISPKNSGRVFVVEELKQKEGNNTPPSSLNGKCIWFRDRADMRRLLWAAKSNIRRVTKLDKVLR